MSFEDVVSYPAVDRQDRTSSRKRAGSGAGVVAAQREAVVESPGSTAGLFALPHVVPVHQGKESNRQIPRSLLPRQSHAFPAVSLGRRSINVERAHDLRGRLSALRIL